MFEGPAGPDVMGAGAPVGGVTIVEVNVLVLVLVMVDTELVTWIISLVPDVMVFVTGHVVKVVYSLQKISNETLVLLTITYTTVVTTSSIDADGAGLPVTGR